MPEIRTLPITENLKFINDRHNRKFYIISNNKTYIIDLFLFVLSSFKIEDINENSFKFLFFYDGKVIIDFIFDSYNNKEEAKKKLTNGMNWLLIF